MRVLALVRKRARFRAFLKIIWVFIHWTGALSITAPSTARPATLSPYTAEVLMRIGVPKEVKHHEYRIGLSPASVAVLVQQGHDVRVQLPEYWL